MVHAILGSCGPPTMNGVEERIESVISNRISRVGISLDGATAAVFERIRVGARFDRVVENFRLLTDMKEASGSATPEIRMLPQAFLSGSISIH